MKKVLLATTLLFLFAIGLSAQISADHKAKGKDFIEQAKEYATQQEFALAAQYLQKAYNISPSLLDCKAIQLLGISYYMMEDSSPAIKFLELSAKCAADKEALALIYTYLSDSYLEMGHYKQAVESFLKAISNTTDDKEISLIYEELANMHFDVEDTVKTIESMQQGIAHYLNHLSITEEAVMSGSVKNEELGKRYFNLTWFASAFNLESVMLNSVVKAALCGDKDAISYCIDNNIAYQEAIVLPTTTIHEDDAATALIEQAVGHASKQEYKSVIPKLEKAYSISPTMFDGNTFHLMGLAYYRNKKYPSAIKYFERALQFDLDKKSLHFIYGTLADAYNVRKDYTKALKNAEKALYLTNGDEDVLKCSLRLASIYYAQDDYNSTIDSYQNAIRYYMKIHSITENQVMEGHVRDEFLAKTHLKLTYLLNELMRSDASHHHLEKAALCGSEYAIELLEKE